MSYRGETTELRWFEETPSCRQCGKQSHGVLRGSRNESYGAHCRKCAERRLKDSKKAREIEAATPPHTTGD